MNTSTLVPIPSEERIANLPFTKRTRSSMQSKPKPPLLRLLDVKTVSRVFDAKTDASALASELYVNLGRCGVFADVGKASCAIR